MYRYHDLHTDIYQLLQLRASRVSEDHPLRIRRRLLCEKLEIVKGQVTTIEKMKQPANLEKNEVGNKYLEYKT